MTTTSESFVAAVMPCIDVVHNLARRLAHRRVDAEDLVQETLENAWASWCTGSRPESLKPWLSTICLNLARDRARKTGRRPEVGWPVGLDPVDAVDVADVALRHVQLAVVEQALWTLPEHQRVAITLMDICGLTAAETAQVQQCSRGTVLARVHRGRKALARAVNGLAEDPAAAREDRTGLQDGGGQR